jgi:hypothetical protein
MQGRGRRILLLAAGGVAVWYLVVLFSWALRPLHDAIPVGVNPRDGKPVSQEVSCNTLFAGHAHEGALPTLPTRLPLYGQQYVYNRDACTLVQRDARIVFTLDTLGAIVVIGGLLYIALRSPLLAPAPPPAGTSTSTSTSATYA